MSVEAVEATETLTTAVAQVWGEEAPVESAPPPDPATDPEPDAVKSKVEASEKYLRARRAEDRDRQKREQFQAEMRAEREKLDRERAEWQADVELAKRVRSARSKPSEALGILELGPKEFIESLATENEPSAVAARAVEVERAERLKLEARLAEVQSKLEASEHQAKMSQHEALSRKAEEGFLELVIAGKTAEGQRAYPTLLNEFTAEEIVAHSYMVLEEVVGRDAKGRPVTRVEAYRAEHGGQNPPDDEIAEFLEARARQRAEARTAWRQRWDHGEQPADGGEEGKSVATLLESGSRPRTMTSRDASVRAAAPKPWSQEQADEESLRILRAAMRK